MIIKLTKELIKKKEDVKFEFFSNWIASSEYVAQPIDLAVIAEPTDNETEISVNCHDCGVQSDINGLARFDINTEQNSFSISLCNACHRRRHRQSDPLLEVDITIEQMANEYHN